MSKLGKSTKQQKNQNQDDDFMNIIEEYSSKMNPHSPLEIITKVQKYGFIFEDFAKSGINEETIWQYIKNGYLTETEEYWEMFYPAFMANYKTDYYNRRLKHPEYGKGKYIKPKGQPSRIFRPLGLSLSILNDPNQYIILTEGDKKAIKAVQEGFNCISLSGVWNWKQKVKQYNKNQDGEFVESVDNEIYGDIIPDLVQAEFESKTVYLCYDNDMWHNPNVKQALYHLAAYLLSEKKSIVKIVELPKGDAKGLDDYLIAYGANSFQNLLNDAKEMTLKDVQNKLSGKKGIIDFPLSIFPENIAAKINDLHKRFDAPIEYIACTFIAVLSIVMNGHFKVIANPHSDWSEYPILWLAIIGNPSQKKTPCINIGRVVLNDLDDALYTNFEFQMLEYKKLSDLRKTTIDKQKSLKKKSSNENAEQINVPDEPIKPTRARLTIQNATVESLIDVQEKNKNLHLGVSIVNDELSFFFKSFNQYKGKGNDLQYYIQAWSNNRQNFVRVSRKIDCVTEIGHNILGGIQPTVLNDLFFKNGTETTDGFIERWLYVCSKYLETGEKYKINEPYDISCFQDLCKNLFAKAISEPSKLYVYRFDSEAQDLFDKFCSEIVNLKKTKNISDLMKSYLQKQTNYVARFAMILHAFNNTDSNTITSTTVDNAIKLSKYFISCFVNVINFKLNDDPLEKSTITYLKTKEIKTISPTQLYKNNRNKYKNAEQAKIILENLVSKGYGRMLKAKNGVKFINYC